MSPTFSSQKSYNNLLTLCLFKVFPKRLAGIRYNFLGLKWVKAVTPGIVREVVASDTVYNFRCHLSILVTNESTSNAD